MNEMILEAKTENIQVVTAWIDSVLEKLNCPLKCQMQIDVAVDELFSNIAQYAYPKSAGSVTVRLACEDRLFSITFIDKGIAYDPLKKEDPDVSLPAEKRQVGGLGIYLVKKTMDSIIYRRQDDCNILTIQKRMDN